MIRMLQIYISCHSNIFNHDVCIRAVHLFFIVLVPSEHLTSWLRQWFKLTENSPYSSQNSRSVFRNTLSNGSLRHKMSLLSYIEGNIEKSLSNVLLLSAFSDYSFSCTVITVQLRFIKVILKYSLRARLLLLCPAPSGMLAMNFSLSWFSVSVWYEQFVPPDAQQNLFWQSVEWRA